MLDRIVVSGAMQHGPVVPNDHVTFAPGVRQHELRLFGTLPADVPLGFVGETLDGSGGFMPCAPQADNFLSFFAAAAAPALAVTVNGANHMSFLDDVASCGFTCSFCNMATLDNATVNGMSRAYAVAFYERHLRNNTGYRSA